LPPFVDHFIEHDGSWLEEQTDAEMPVVQVLADQVSALKGLSLTGVSMVANWRACRVIPLKKQVHPSWEYNMIHDLTYEVNRHITKAKLETLSKEMFQSMEG
jgi:hypothetical protein